MMFGMKQIAKKTVAIIDIHHFARDRHPTYDCTYTSHARSHVELVPDVDASPESD